MDASGAGKDRAPPAPAGAGAYGGYEGAGDRKWWPWLVPTVIVACIAVFVVEMWVNDCPKHGSALGAGQPCVAGFLRRFSFQPLRENPLLGPSSATYVPCYPRSLLFCSAVASSNWVCFEVEFGCTDLGGLS
jgi:hypothetical protein